MLPRLRPDSERRWPPSAPETRFPAAPRLPRLRLLYLPRVRAFSYGSFGLKTIALPRGPCAAQTSTSRIHTPPRRNTPLLRCGAVATHLHTRGVGLRFLRFDGRYRQHVVARSNHVIARPVLHSDVVNRLVHIRVALEFPLPNPPTLLHQKRRHSRLVQDAVRIILQQVLIAFRRSRVEYRSTVGLSPFQNSHLCSHRIHDRPAQSLRPANLRILHQSRLIVHLVLLVPRPIPPQTFRSFDRLEVPRSRLEIPWSRHVNNSW